jgi:hypothetical protein
MKNSGNRAKTAVAIVLVLLMAIVTLTANMPVKAQTILPAGTIPTNLRDPASVPLPAGVTPDLTLDTIAHMSFRPNPIGVGQPLLVNLWIEPNLWAGRGFVGLKVTFTRPDGTSDVQTVNSYVGDATAWFEYIVDKVGTWQIKFDFPGGYFPAGNYSTVEATNLAYGVFYSFPQSVYYKPSSDGPYNFTVQEELALSWPPSSFPNDYWTRPASPENREWWPILGSYPSTGVVGGGPNWPANTNTYMSNYLYIPYVIGPNTAHIVWRRQGDIGGILGGSLGQKSWPKTNAGGPSIVCAGRCYQTVTKAVNGVMTSVWQCYDLRTGEVYWELIGLPNPTMVFYDPGWTGGKYGLHAQAGEGGLGIYLAALSGGRVIAYNLYSGTVFFNVSISPFTSGTFYAYTDYPYFLTVQNIGTTVSPNYRLINWTVANSATSAMTIGTWGMKVMNNVSWPFSSLGSVDYEAGIAVNTLSVTSVASGVPTDAYIMAASLTTGTLLWNVSAGVGYGIFSGSTAVADQGKFAVRFNDGHWHCWDLSRGTHLWKSELTTWPWGTFGCYGVQSYGGMIISNQYDGVAAFNWTNGKVAWHYIYTAPYPYETPYQDNYPWFTGTSRIADGKLYSYNTEHSPTQPYTRGWKLHCINVTTGEGIWNITGSMSPGAIADGYLTASSAYDGYMYVFGKGKSSTTVQAPLTAVPLGTALTIQGTVMDMSPGDQGSFQNPTAPLDSPTAPGTVPCVSKDSMATQMEYLYMQHPIDGLFHNATITGVPVTLTAIASDGTYTDLGTVTSNGYYGTFSKAWTPTKEDTYTIVASFAADDSYGSSSAATAVTVGPAPAVSPTPTPPEVAPDNTPTYILGATIAIILAVAIATILILRKRT